MDIVRRINRCRFRCGCVFGLWKEMVAHDQDSIGNPVLPPRIVVGVLDHDGAGQSEQGLGFALAMKVRVIPVQSRGMIIRYGDFIGAHTRPARRRLVLGNEIRGEDVVARRNARTAWQRFNLQSVEMQVGVAGGFMIGAGHNIEISRCPGDARKAGGVAGRRCLLQNGCVIDAIEQAHAEHLTGTYPNRWRNPGPIAVVTIDEAEAVAILTDFELDRLNPAIYAGHLRRGFQGPSAPGRNPLAPAPKMPPNPSNGQTTSANSRLTETARIISPISLMMSLGACRSLPRSSRSCSEASAHKFARYHERQSACLATWEWLRVVALVLMDRASSVATSPWICHHVIAADRKKRPVARAKIGSGLCRCGQSGRSVSESRSKAAYVRSRLAPPSAPSGRRDLRSDAPARARYRIRPQAHAG